MRASLVLALGAATLVACGGKYGGADPKTPRGVVSAALPYRIVDARTGRDVTENDAWMKLAGSRAVCVGEEHPNPHHHWAQMRVVEELGKRAKLAGVSLALGMEMFQRPYQGVLDDYAAGRIDDNALVSRSGWADRWGYEFSMYQPILKQALAANATLVALNPAKELVKRMSREGYDKLTPEEKAQVPELKLDDARHRAWFDGLMAAMGGSHAHSQKGGDGAEAKPPTPEEEAEAKAKSERIYAVQVMWDESMAEGAAKWVNGQTGRAMIILAGNGHCHDSAVVDRIKRRGVADAVSLMPIIDDGANVAEELAAPVNDYLFVMTLPAGTKPAEPAAATE
jgi:uncharacterized iron-regulated protein